MNINMGGGGADVLAARGMDGILWGTGAPQSVMGDSQAGKAVNTSGEKCLI